MAYTYLDFENAAKKAGLLNQFSPYDLDLARKDPSAGLSILSYKQEYAGAVERLKAAQASGDAAADAAARQEMAQINRSAETVRSAAGGYTGGFDGSKYYAAPVAQSEGARLAGAAPTRDTAADAQTQAALQRVLDYPDYQYDGPSAPAYAPKYDGQIADQLETLKHNASYQYGGPAAPTYAPKYDEQTQKALTDYLDHPEYASRYQPDIEALAAALAKPEPFSYDAGTDPVYQSYAKQYAREGQRATEHTLGAAAAATGGIPSSYAVGAAQQAGDYYAAQLSDRIPQLYADAYQRYLQQFTQQQASLGVLQQQEATEYQRYLDQLALRQDRIGALQALDAMDYARYRDSRGDWESDRAYDYGVYADGYARQQDLLSALQRQDATDYARYRDARGDFESDRAYDQGIWAANYDRRQSDLNAARGIASDSRNAYLDALEQYNQDRSFGQTSEQLAYQQTQDAMDRARQEQLDTYNRDQDAMDRAIQLDQIQYNRQKDQNELAAALPTPEERDAGSNYSTIALTLQEMQRQGFSKEQILARLQDARAQGLIKSSDYNRLYNQLRG